MTIYIIPPGKEPDDEQTFSSEGDVVPPEGSKIKTYDHPAKEYSTCVVERIEWEVARSYGGKDSLTAFVYLAESPDEEDL